MVELRSYSVFGSGAVFQFHASVARPAGLTVGDLLLFSVAMTEDVDGFGAFTANSSAPAAFTDLLLDGTHAKLQYILDPISSPASSWWLGWKWADAGDVAASSFQVDVDSGSFGGSPVGAGNIHMVLAALTGFNATTPFGNTNYQNDIPGLPVPVPAVTTDEGIVISDKRLTSSGGGLGQRSLWVAITHAADGTEELLVAGEAINTGTVSMVSGAGMIDILINRLAGSFYLGRGFAIKPMSVHLRHPDEVGHDA